MTTSCPQPTDARERTIRAELGRGVALPDRLRDALERAYGADLDAVRLHGGETADGLAASAHADACTTGADVFFRAGALRPDSDAGLDLLAHEVAHVVQQAGSRRSCESETAEAEAVVMARAFARGRLPDRPRRHPARPLGAGDALVLQCHSSWEHRMLGDLRTLDFGTIAAGGANRRAYLQRVQQFLHMWATNPKAVSAAQITADFHDIRPLRLRGSGLVVTYGELNTLADYLATPAELDAMPEHYLLPILQQVRQEGYAWVTWVLEEKWLDKQVVFGGFEGSVADTLGSDSADAIWETLRMDAHTQAFGPQGTDHYSGVLARNACHFAPHSWYRWEQFHLQARAFAVEAYHATGDRKERLKDLAWIHHGYADHFLHDSFAAGHLVNKTLVMQWYLDWVRNTLTHVPDWDLVQFMTLARQPDLAGRPLYSAFNTPAARGDVRDPQTANEHRSLARRMAVSGVRPDGSTVGGSYKRWLAFLGCGVVQLASNTVHDHFNSSSLWVSSDAHPQAFQIYGDNTMIRGGDGYQIASETAQLSQRSLSDLLGTGTTDVTPADIAKRFPSKVHDPAAPSVTRTLEQWAYGFQNQAGTLFDGFKNRAVGFLSHRIAPVNIDNTGGWRWTPVPGKATDIAVGGDLAVWSIGTLGSDGNGAIQYWDPASSSWKAHTGAGVRIAADGSGVVWVVNAAGYSYRKARGSDAWERGQLPKVNNVDGLVDIAAGTDGSVWGLAKAPVAGGHQLMRCVPGSGTHTWEPVTVGATAVSVGPDGLPWVVNDAGVVMNLTPGTGPDRYSGDGALWTDVSPQGCKASDVGLGVGPLLCAWIAAADGNVLAWNGRQPNQPKSGARLLLDWENVGGEAVRISTGPDGLPWVVNQSGNIHRLVAMPTATAEFTTHSAGKVTGAALAAGGSLFQGESVSINGSTDLSKVIVGNSGACVYSIRLDRSPIPAVNYRLYIDGQGPEGGGSGWMYIYIEDEGGFTEYKGFWSREHHPLTIDYNGSKAGIKRISWSDKDDPGDLTSGQLLYYRDTTLDGTGDVGTPTVIGLGGWQQYRFLFSGGNGIIYAVHPDGRLLFYRDKTLDGTGDVGTPTVIGRGGWQNFRSVFSGGNGIIYAVHPDGRLLFYRDKTLDGTGDVGTPTVIGRGGWQNFRSVFSGGNGIMNAVHPDGRLLFYRDKTLDGTGDVGTPTVIGRGGWQNFRSVFSGGNGIIYAVHPDGRLLFYRDKTLDGTGDVGTPTVIGRGGWQNFRSVFSGGNGIIYAVTGPPDLQDLTGRYYNQ